MNKSFDKIDLIVNQDADYQTFSAKVKSKFKQTSENRLRDDIFQINDSNTRYDNVVEFYNNDDYRLIKKAIARNKFYRFDNMKRYLPMLSSIKEFIKSQKWLF